MEQLVSLNNDIQIAVPIDWPKGVHIGVTARYGGVSTEPYTSLNLGAHVGDNPVAVIENRRRLAHMLQLDVTQLTCADQVHGHTVHVVRERDIGCGALDNGAAIVATDAMVTNLHNVPLLIFTADCVGVGMYDPVQHAIGVAHAGWRGAIRHIAKRTLETMVEAYGTNPADCYAFIGPSIGPQSFEVGPEVVDAFYRETEKCRFSPVVHTVSTDTGKGYVDLWSFVSQDLSRCGVSHITVSGIDTAQDKRFYSYRRECGHTGRMALFMSLIDD